jgi:hypothetical protein
MYSEASGASNIWKAKTSDVFHMDLRHLRYFDAGTSDTPSPAATRLNVDSMRGASWPIRGLNPVRWQAAMIANQTTAREGVGNGT